MGWFVTDRFEMYGEGTLLVYTEPERAVAGGLAGLAGRLHLWNDRGWTPYVTLGGGILWTSLDTREIDRRFNFQILYGLGVRLLPRLGRDGSSRPATTTSRTPAPPVRTSASTPRP